MTDPEESAAAAEASAPTQETTGRSGVPSDQAGTAESSTTVDLQTPLAATATQADPNDALATPLAGIGMDTTHVTATDTATDTAADTAADTGTANTNANATRSDDTVQKVNDDTVNEEDTSSSLATARATGAFTETPSPYQATAEHPPTLLLKTPHELNISVLKDDDDDNDDNNSNVAVPLQQELAVGETVETVETAATATTTAATTATAEAAKEPVIPSTDDFAVPTDNNEKSSSAKAAVPVNDDPTAVDTSADRNKAAIDDHDVKVVDPVASDAMEIDKTAATPTQDALQGDSKLNSKLPLKLPLTRAKELHHDVAPAPPDTAASLQEAFDDFTPTTFAARRKSKTRKTVKIAVLVSVTSKTKAGEDDAWQGIESEMRKPSFVAIHNDKSGYDFYQDEIIESELEDSLAFFQETHEEQDPRHVIYKKRSEQDSMKTALAQLHADDQKGRREVDAVIAEHMQEKQAQTEHSLDKYRQRVTQEEANDKQRLQVMYQQKSTSNQSKIAQGVKILQRRHEKELQGAMQHHRQQAQQRRVPEQIAATEWQSTLQQTQAKQQRQLQEFGRKGEELKAKTEGEFKKETTKIRNTMASKMKDIESNKQKIFAKLYAALQQHRQRYLKRHLQSIMKKKRELLQIDEPIDGSSSSNSPRDIVKMTMEEKVEHRPPSPIKSIPEWAQDSPYEMAGGASRHKNRKSVMSQASRQLSVELHNEGLWVGLIKTREEDSASGTSTKKDETVDQHFIPFGVKAHAVLEAIVAGEIPNGYDRFDYGESLALQGGQIRCVVQDLRTSGDTASLTRAAAAKELEDSYITDLETKVTELNVLAAEAEKAMNDAEAEKKEREGLLEAAAEDAEKAKRMLEEFKTKFRNFLDSDGNPLATANPSDRQELLKAISRYKGNMESAALREKSARQSVSDNKTRLTKVQAEAKSAQKNANLAANLLRKKKIAASNAKAKGARPSRQSEAAELERAATRVKDVIGALQKTADKRREQCNQKKQNGVSTSWIQSFNGLSGSLKKSLWHKIHRRKQQIVLRPTPENLLNDLRSSVVEAIADGSRSTLRRAALEDELIKAEQLYLLATHPMAEGGLSSVPPLRAGGSWAEPGWQLVLDVPQETERGQSILPCASSFPVLERNLSEISSAPGRQAASMVRTSYLRCLASPLSTFSIVSAPAETNASLSLGSKFE